MNNNTKYLLAGIAGVFVGFIIAPWFSYPQMGMGGRQIGMMNQNNMDRHFIEEMIPHHDGAILMAELALERSQRPEIISLANGIIDAQKRENEQMRGWYADWFGRLPDGSMSMGGMMGHGNMDMHMMGMTGDLDYLSNAEDFDLEFISQMIPHHEMAIMMARMILSGTKRPELKKLADDIITSQSREIQMMRSWYEAWSK